MEPNGAVSPPGPYRLLPPRRPQVDPRPVDVVPHQLDQIALPWLLHNGAVRAESALQSQTAASKLLKQDPSREPLADTPPLSPHHALSALLGSTLPPSAPRPALKASRQSRGMAEAEAVRVVGPGEPTPLERLIGDPTWKLAAPALAPEETEYLRRLHQTLTEDGFVSSWHLATSGVLARSTFLRGIRTSSRPEAHQSTGDHATARASRISAGPAARSTCRTATGRPSISTSRSRPLEPSTRAPSSTARVSPANSPRKTEA